MDTIYWSSLPVVPKKVKWPVRVVQWGDRCVVFCHSDNAYFKVPKDGLVPFPGPYDILKNQGIDVLTRKKQVNNLKAFLGDIQWHQENYENCCKDEAETAIPVDQARSASVVPEIPVQEVANQKKPVGRRKKKGQKRKTDSAQLEDSPLVNKCNDLQERPETVQGERKCQELTRCEVPIHEAAPDPGENCEVQDEAETAIPVDQAHSASVGPEIPVQQVANQKKTVGWRKKKGQKKKTDSAQLEDSPLVNKYNDLQERPETVQGERKCQELTRCEVPIHEAAPDPGENCEVQDEAETAIPVDQAHSASVDPEIPVQEVANQKKTVGRRKKKGQKKKTDSAQLEDSPLANKCNDLQERPETVQGERKCQELTRCEVPIHEAAPDPGENCEVQDEAETAIPVDQAHSASVGPEIPVQEERPETVQRERKCQELTRCDVPIHEAAPDPGENCEVQDEAETAIPVDQARFASVGLEIPVQEGQLELDCVPDSGEESPEISFQYQYPGLLMALPNTDTEKMISDADASDPAGHDYMTSSYKDKLSDSSTGNDSSEPEARNKRKKLNKRIKKELSGIPKRRVLEVQKPSDISVQYQYIAYKIPQPNTDTENMISDADASDPADRDYMPSSNEDKLSDSSTGNDSSEPEAKNKRKKLNKRIRKEGLAGIPKRRKLEVQKSSNTNAQYQYIPHKIPEPNIDTENVISDTDASDPADRDYMPSINEDKLSDSSSGNDSSEPEAKNKRKKLNKRIRKGLAGIPKRRKSSSTNAQYQYIPHKIPQPNIDTENVISDTDASDPADRDYMPSSNEDKLSDSSTGNDSSEPEARNKRKKLNKKMKKKRLAGIAEMRKSYSMSDIREESDFDMNGNNVKKIKETVYRKMSNFDKKNSARDVKNKHIYVRKVLKSKYSQSGKRKKHKTVWDQVHCCKFCKQIRSNIAKHLKKHHKQQEVKEIVELGQKLGKKNKFVQAKWNMLRNEGDDMNNNFVLSAGKGEIILGRRQTENALDIDEYGPCPGCKVWIKLNKTMYHHQKNCPAEILGISDLKEKSGKELRILSLYTSGRIKGEASKALRNEVFPVMRNDEVSRIAQKDVLIIALGNLWLLKNIGNRLKRKYYASQRMRDAARMLINLRKQAQNDLTLFDFLIPESFDCVVKAALTTASPDFDDLEDLKSPSTAIKLGYDIKRMVGAKWAMCLKNKKIEEVTNCDNFLKLMQLEWYVRVAKVAHVTLQTRRFNQDRTLPNPEDLVSLQNHLKAEVKKLELDQTSPTIFRRAVELSQTRLLMYNKRRSGELEAISVKQYLRRQSGVTDIEKSMRSNLSPLEIHLLESQELLETRGKGGRGVPVIIPGDIQPVLEYIVDSHVRHECGIHPSNEYLFPNTALGAVRAYESLKNMCSEVNLKRPEQITSVNLRKYTATISQIFDLNPAQQQWLVNHLGHSFDVHKEHYRQTSGVIERIDISKLMLMQEFNIQGRYAGKKFDEIELTELVFGTETTVDSDENADEAAPLDGCVDVELLPDLRNKVTFDEFDFHDDEDVNTSKKKNSARTRVKWTVKETEEILLYFKDNLKTLTTPGRQECEKAIKQSRLNDGELWRRSWETIKKKVWNEIKKS